MVEMADATDRQTDRPIDQPTDRPIDQPTDRPTDRPTGIQRTKVDSFKCPGARIPSNRYEYVSFFPPKDGEGRCAVRGGALLVSFFCGG